MPGYDQLQASLMAQTAAATALQQLAQDQKAVAAQSLAQVEMVRKFCQPPSVFWGGSIVDMLATYTLNDSSLDVVNWKKVLQLASMTVGVFPLNSAAVVRPSIICWNNVATASVLPLPLIVAYALSAENNTNPIPANQFALMRNAARNSTTNLTQSVWVQNVWDEIPCAGNQYIHIMGAGATASALNLIAAAATTQNTPFAAITYTLAK